MKKQLTPQDLAKIKELLDSSNPNNWELAKELLKGVVIATPSFLTYLFCRAYFSYEKKLRALTAKLLKKSSKELWELGDGAFQYYKNMPKSAVKCAYKSFYLKLRELFLHTAIDTKILIQFFNEHQHEYHKAKKLPLAIFLLGLEFSLLSKDQLDNIQQLELTTLDLESFPKEIKKLSQLRQISCHFQAFTKLSEELKELPELDFLYLHGIYLDENGLDPYTFTAPNLKHLQFLSCRIKGTPQFWAALSNIKQLEKLSMSYNRLDHIPASIQNLQNLKYLDISANEELAPKDISLEVFRLPKLEYLRLNSYIEHQKEIVALATQHNPKLEIKFKEPPSSEYDWVGT
ncbi:MAG: leucine-rich repeat domain-containing protein [Aureispira sp.]|nr:leucine-rich repeat domain-containing protein [Aureispira sp.]